jgi:hypothetical protein
MDEYDPCWTRRRILKQVPGHLMKDILEDQCKAQVIGAVLENTSLLARWHTCCRRSHRYAENYSEEDNDN